MIKQILSGVVGIFIALGILYLIPQQGTSKLGSIVTGSSYYSTSTNATWNAPNFVKLLKLGQGEVGSCVITNKDNGGQSNLILYDASTSINGAVYGTSTIANFGSSTPPGTYQIDGVFRYGLLAEVPSTGTIASTTCTWR